MQYDLFLQPLCLQHLLILLRLVHAQVIQELAALSDFAKQTAAGGVILLVFLQVIGQHRDFLCENRDLDLGGAGVLFVELAVFDQLLLGTALEGHRTLEDR